jgi:hypothetical protein
MLALLTWVSSDCVTNEMIRLWILNISASDTKALRISIIFAIDVCGNSKSDKETLSQLVRAIVSGISREKEWDDEVFKKNLTGMKVLNAKFWKPNFT